MGKSRKVAAETESEPEEEVYHVEVITKARVAPLSDDEQNEFELDEHGKRRPKTAKWEYYVKWAGYDSDACSWEPEQNVAGCQRLLSSFWSHVGLDTKDYPVGTIFKASDKWIKKEKRYFQQEFNQAKEQSLRERQREEKKKKSKKRTKGLLTGRTQKRKRVDSSSSEDQPLSHAIPPAKIQKVEEPEMSLAIEVVPDPTERSPSPANSLFSENALSNAEVPAPPAPPVVESSKPRRPIPLPPKNRKSHTTNPFLSTTPPAPSASPAAPPAAPTPPLSAPASSLSGIPTKQRLAQDALTFTDPKSLVQKSKAAKPPTAKSTMNALRDLNFRKNKPEGPVLARTDDAVPTQKKTDEPTLAALNAGAASPTREGHAVLGTVSDTFVESPMDIAGSDSLVHYFEGIGDNDIHPSRVSTSQAVSFSQMQAAENFLRETLPQVATPLAPASEPVFEPQPPKALRPKEKAISLPPRPLRDNQWSGQLTFEVDGGTQTLCKVIMTDYTESKENALRLPIVVAPLQALHILSFHDAADLRIVLRACKPVDQSARVGPCDEQDIDPLRILVAYMLRKEKVALMPIIIDHNFVGHMLLFPCGLDFLCTKCNIPLELRRQDSLIASIFSWRLTQTQIGLDRRRPPIAYVSAEPAHTRYVSSDRWYSTVRSLPLYQVALRVLRFPKSLYEFMADGHDRSYAIFGNQLEKPKKRYAYETAFLRVILDQCGQKAFHTSKSEWRVAFIHISALGQLVKFQKFVEKRATRPELQFYTYGTHDSVPPDEWGIREIYPCGGVVTFTAHALSQNASAVYRLIKQIEEHPLWLAYITPTALGLAIHHLAGAENPFAFSERPNFPLQLMMSAINEGIVSLISAPPLPHAPTKGADPCSEWIRQHLYCKPSSPRSIVEHAVHAWKVKYATLPPARWNNTFKSEIVDDILLMQRQPSLMREYRRYVIIRGNESGFDSDTVESATLTGFNFHDNFFLEK